MSAANSDTDSSVSSTGTREIKTSIDLVSKTISAKRVSSRKPDERPATPPQSSVSPQQTEMFAVDLMDDGDQPLIAMPPARKKAKLNDSNASESPSDDAALNELRARLEQVKKSLEERDLALKEKERALLEKDRECQQYFSMSEELEKSKDKIVASMKGLEATHRATVADHQKSQQLIAELQRALAERESALGELKTAHAAEIERVKALVDEARQSNREREESLRQEIDLLKRQLADAKEAEKAHSDNLVRACYETATAKLDPSNIWIQSLKNSYDNSKEEAARFKSLYEQSQAEIKRITAALEQARWDRDNLQKELRELRIKSDTLNDTIRNLGSLASTDAAERKLREQKEQYEDRLQQQKEQYERRLSESKEKMVDAELNARRYMDLLHDARSDADNARREIRNLQDQLRSQTLSANHLLAVVQAASLQGNHLQNHQPPPPQHYALPAPPQNPYDTPAPPVFTQVPRNFRRNRPSASVEQLPDDTGSPSSIRKPASTQFHGGSH